MVAGSNTTVTLEFEVREPPGSGEEEPENPDESAGETAGALSIDTNSETLSCNELGCLSSTVDVTLNLRTDTGVDVELSNRADFAGASTQRSSLANLENSSTIL